MIFKPSHVEQIKKGTKTQTRRVNRSYYRVGHDYAVQAGRGKKAGMRIVIDAIEFESILAITGTMINIPLDSGLRSRIHVLTTSHIPISVGDALAEGGYTPEEYEAEFKRVYPKWDGLSRWVFKFHVKED